MSDFGDDLDVDNDEDNPAPFSADPSEEEIVIPEVDDEPGLEKPLLPRQRKLCELAAQGLRQIEIAEKLHYSPNRVSILLKNPQIALEVMRVRERMFEESVMGRLKKMADPALNVIEAALTDRRNVFKKSEQIDVSKWVLEKLDGKATQKLDVGSSSLAGMLDRLDQLKNSGQNLLEAPRDVTPHTPGKTEEERDLLKDWVDSFKSDT